MQPQPGWQPGQHRPQQPQQPPQPRPQQPRPPHYPGPVPHPHTPPHAYAHQGPPPQPPARGRRLWPIILAVALGAVIIASGAGGAAWWFLLRAEEKITVDGTFLIHDSGLENGETCWGDGGYSDIAPGTQVTVTNEAGTVLAIGKLGTGSGTILGCSFSFTVEVEAGHKFYGFEVSRRGTVRYTEAEIRDGVELSLGD